MYPGLPNLHKFKGYIFVGIFAKKCRKIFNPKILANTNKQKLWYSNRSKMGLLHKDPKKFFNSEIKPFK